MRSSFSSSGGSGYSLAGGAESIGFDGYFDIDTPGDLLTLLVPDDFSPAPGMHQLVVNGRIMRVNRDYTVTDGRIVFVTFLPAATAIAMYYVRQRT